VVPSFIGPFARTAQNAPNAPVVKGHPLNVLTVTYPGGRTRQFSLRPELIPQVRSCCQGQRGKAGVHIQSLHQECGAPARAEEALVP
jgi:hypothetical protein